MVDSIKIIFEDNYFVVINKPYGLIVNRSQTVSSTTLQDWVEKQYPNKFTDKRTEFHRRSGIVHRLDKDTTGLLLIAKDEFTFCKLQQQFKKRQVEKKYFCLAHGVIEPKMGDIYLPLSRSPKNRQKHAVRLKGKIALTYYQRNNIFADNNGHKYSYLEINLKTGRTHQIRVHLSFLNHPIVSDPIYLNKTKYQQDLTWCSRLFLHSFLLSFFHPYKQKKVTFKINLPLELTSVLEKLYEI